MKRLSLFLTVLVMFLLGVGFVAEGATLNKNPLGVSPNIKKVQGFSVGAARVKIKVPDNFFPYTSFRGRYYTGIHDDLYVRAIMVVNQTGKALFLSVDTGDLSDEWLGKICALSGVPESNIYLTATHTHEAPYISRTEAESTLKDVDKSKAFATNAWNALAEAIQTAMKNLQPGKVSYGTGACDINVNRNYKNADNKYITGSNPQGISDKTVSVMMFANASGQPIAYLYNYAVHSVVMFFSQIQDNGMFLSGDLAGATSRYIEERNGNKAVALWTMAPAADQNPRYMSSYSDIDAQGNPKNIDFGKAGYVLLDVQAQNLGTEVLRVAANMKKFDAEAQIKGITKTIPVAVKSGRTPINLRLGLLMVDNVAFVGFPGELVTSVGLAIKDNFKSLKQINTMIVTQCNGSNGYFSDDFGYQNQTFDGNASSAQPGYDKKVIEAEKEMLKTLTSK